MKFTSKELANAMGLKVGDRVKIKDSVGNSCVYELDSKYCLSGNYAHMNLDDIIELDYEILPKKKKIGDLFCSTIECVDCPLCAINCKGFGDDTLYEQLKKSVAECDSELYDILRARLDKEVEE